MEIHFSPSFNSFICQLFFPQINVFRNLSNPCFNAWTTCRPDEKYSKEIVEIFRAEEWTYLKPLYNDV